MSSPRKNQNTANTQKSSDLKSDDLNLEDMVKQLLALNQDKPHKLFKFEESHLMEILHKAKILFEQESAMIEIEGPIKICGDIHGQYYDLLRLFDFGGLPPNTSYLFLGDYVDRGKQSIEVIILLFSLKILYPRNIFLIRGNHEVDTINRIYGFYDECKRRFSIKLWKKFGDVFSFMPITALVCDRLLCMHGGLSPDLVNLNQLRNIQKPIIVHDQGLICDILWSDPQLEITGWGENERGVSYVFGIDIVTNFVKKQNLDLIVRAHQVVEDGYEFFANKKLVTVFSAPNYCDEFENSAGILNVTKDLECSFQILAPISKRKNNKKQF